MRVVYVKIPGAGAFAYGTCTALGSEQVGVVLKGYPVSK